MLWHKMFDKHKHKSNGGYEAGNCSIPSLFRAGLGSHIDSGK